MSKRKFTERQTRDFEQRQHAQAARAHTSDADTPEQTGLVISRFGRHAHVENTSGDIFHCAIRATIESVVTGDKVVWQHDNNQQGVIVAILPRTSALTRADSRGIAKVLAANIEQMLIVIAPLPPAHTNLIDRYLVAAHIADMAPIILLNKMDLLDNDEAEKNRIVALLDLYHRIGYATLMTSTQADENLDALRAQLNNKTNIFVGQSGVGKSSLINALLPDVDAVVGDLSEGTDKGTHTTTAARLFHLPTGGTIIDSPGIREYHLNHVDKAELINHFIDIAPFIGQCKFRNCSHDQEPDCAIKQAIDDGQIDSHRWDSYYRILNSLD